MTHLTSGCVNESDKLAAVVDRHRRLTLRILQHAGEPLSLMDLAIELVRRETGHEAPGAECEHVERMQVALFHVHVPKLAAAGLVEFDPDQQLVTLLDPGMEMVSYFERMPELFK